jgi:hypothetical protein
MGGYVDPTEQLVIEVVVKEIGRSVDFYRRLGFELLRDGGDFVELTWEHHRLFLAELSASHDARDVELPARQTFPIANVRVMVANVDGTGSSPRKWEPELLFPLRIATTVCATSRSRIQTGSASALQAYCKGGNESRSNNRICPRVARVPPNQALRADAG